MAPNTRRRTADIWRDRTQAAPTAVQASAPVVAVDDEVEQRITEGVRTRIEAEQLTRRTREEQVAYVRDLIAEFATQQSIGVSDAAERAIAERMVASMTGFGPMQPYLDDPNVTEVMAIGTKHIVIERKGRLEVTATRFTSEVELVRVAQRMAEISGRQVSSGSPICDGRLRDGSRVNICLAPVNLVGGSITVRKFTERLGIDALERLGAFDSRMKRFLEIAISARANILVSGGTGSGKTSLLNALSSFIAPNEHIVTIEDSAELKLVQPIWTPLETRKRTADSPDSEITITHLVRNALRMRPDRIIVGEVRGAEALDLLEAMNTGHDGSMGTLHANSPREAVSRLGTMMRRAGDLSDRVVLEMVESAVDIIIHTAKSSVDGTRRIENIVEISGINPGDQGSAPVAAFTNLFTWTTEGRRDVTGKFLGRWEASTVMPPKLRQRAAQLGLEDDLKAIFDEGAW